MGHYDKEMAEMASQAVPKERIEKPPSVMQEHIRQMECQVQALSRIQTQLDDLLDSVRGPIPTNIETQGIDRAPPGSLVEHLRANDERIHALCNSIDAQVTELQEVF